MLSEKIEEKFKIGNQRVQTTTNTLYNLYIYIEKNEILNVVTYKWKYINIVNSSKFFLSELEEMKSCIYRVETANAGMRL